MLSAEDVGEDVEELSSGDHVFGKKGETELHVASGPSLFREIFLVVVASGVKCGYIWVDYWKHLFWHILGFIFHC